MSTAQRERLIVRVQWTDLAQSHGGRKTGSIYFYFYKAMAKWLCNNAHRKHLTGGYIRTISAGLEDIVRN